MRGNHTFTAQSAVVEDLETEEDSSPKPDREKEDESSAVEDTGVSDKVGGVDQSLGYIIWFANAVELYQKKNQNCSRCDSPDHLVKDCPKDLGNGEKCRFKLEGGDGKEGKPDLSKVGDCSTGYPGQSSPSIKTSQKAPLLNPDPLTH